MPLGFDAGGADRGDPSHVLRWPAAQWNGGEAADDGRTKAPRRGPRLSAGVGVLALLAACAVGLGLLGHGSSRHAARPAGTPVTVCGRVLAPAGTTDDGLHVLSGVTAGGAGARVAEGTVALRWGAGAVYLLRVADGCAHGASLRLTSARAVRVVRTVDAADGLPVAVELEPVYAGETELVAVRPGASAEAVTFEVVTLPAG